MGVGVGVAAVITDDSASYLLALPAKEGWEQALSFSRRCTGAGV